MEFRVTTLKVQSTIRNKNQFQSKWKEGTSLFSMEELSIKAMKMLLGPPDMPIHGIQWKKHQDGLKKTGSALKKLRNIKNYKI